jgi:hypothetical protein
VAAEAGAETDANAAKPAKTMPPLTILRILMLKLPLFFMLLSGRFFCRYPNYFNLSSLREAAGIRYLGAC